MAPTTPIRWLCCLAFSTLLLCLSGCATSDTPPPYSSSPAPATAPRTEQSQVEDKTIALVALQYVSEVVLKDRNEPRFVALSETAIQNVSPAFAHTLLPQTRAKYSKKARRNLDSVTGEPGLTLSVSITARPDDHTATVLSIYSAGEAHMYQLNLEKTGEQWAVTKIEGTTEYLPDQPGPASDFLPGYTPFGNPGRGVDSGSHPRSNPTPNNF